jgi:hypothetical protein
MVNVKSVPTSLNDVFEKYDEEIQCLAIPNHLKCDKDDETNDEKDIRKIFILDCYISRLRNTIFLSDMIIQKLTQDNPDLLKEVLEKINQPQENQT